MEYKYQRKRNPHFDFFSKLSIINFIWFLTVLFGFGIFTFFPACVAVYVLVRSMRSRIEFPLFRSFLKIMKDEYVKGQKVMLLFLLIGAIIGFDLYYFIKLYSNNQSLFHLIGIILFSGLSMGYLMAWIHVFPVYVYFPQLTASQVVRESFRMAIKNVFQTIYLLVIHLFMLILIFLVFELLFIIPLLYFALFSYFSLKVLKPRYVRDLTEVIPLDVQQYINIDYIVGEIPMELKQCQLIAHRGLSRLAPENSMAAFRLAGEKDFFGIEADIQTTQDDVFVMFHDDTLNRMTKRPGKIHQLKYEDIKDLYLTSGYNIYQYPKEKIPLLEDYLTICREYQRVPVAEIKHVNREENLDQIVEIVKEHGLYDQIIIISFNLNYLIYLRQNYSDLQMQYIVNEITPEVIKACEMYRLDVDVNVGRLTPQLINRCHQAGIKVNVWTVDDQTVAQRLIDDGVDYLTTNVYFNVERW